MGEYWNRWEPTWLGWCPKHRKYERILDGGSSRGYVGRIYWTDYACGYHHVDASDDTLEA